MTRSLPILFFADRLPPLIGGMEIHGQYFIQHFQNHSLFPITAILTKNLAGELSILSGGEHIPISLESLGNYVHPEPAFIFFNSGHWIEDFNLIRSMFPKSFLIYRTGGNEILKAPLTHKEISNHSMRQKYWCDMINKTIDLLITNSAYTEDRLRTLGVSCQFKRCLGGVNIADLQGPKPPPSKDITIFCAARFVPYKNHELLISIIHQLILRGHNINLRLAGDGPLLAQTQEKVLKCHIESRVSFLGALDNSSTCREIAQANIYMQLSQDIVTKVLGGEYIHGEGMGRSILEAISAGTYVIAGRSGALPEVVFSPHGVLVDLENKESIIKTVESVINSLPHSLPFSDQFGWHHVFKLYETTLMDLHENTPCN